MINSAKKIYYYVFSTVEILLVRAITYFPQSTFEARCLVLGFAAFGSIGGFFSGGILYDFLSSVVKLLRNFPEDSVVAYFVVFAMYTFALFGATLSSVVLHCSIRVVGRLIVELTIGLPKSSAEVFFMVLGSAVIGFVGGTISGFILSYFDIVSTTSSLASVAADLPVGEGLLKQFEADLHDTPEPQEPQKQEVLANKGTSNFTDWVILGVFALSFISSVWCNFHP